MSTSDVYFVKPNVPFEIEQARLLAASWFRGREITLNGLMALDSRTMIAILRAGQVVHFGFDLEALPGGELEKRLILAPAVLMLIADLRVTL